MLAVCKECSQPYDPDTVYATFRADYEYRVGLAYTGTRPRWVARFCSEPCRYADVNARLKIQNAKATERRAAKRRQTNPDAP
jgi:hypothetical protein